MPPPSRRPRPDDDDDDFAVRPRRRRRAEDSDDFADRPRRSAPKSNAPTVVLVLAGTVLGSLLICGGVGLYVYRSVARGAEEVRQKVAQAAEQAQEEGRKNLERAQAEQAKRKKDEESGDKAQATKLMEQFVAEVKADRLDAAYAFTTAAFQKRVPVADFQRQAGPIARGTNRNLMMRGDVFAPATGSTFTFDGSAGFTEVKIVVVRDGAKWAVDRFTVAARRSGFDPDPDSDRGKATKAVEQFVADLKADRTDAAYKVTTADYQKRVPPADFKRAAAAVSSAGSSLSLRADNWGPTDGSTFTFENWGGSLAVKVTAIREGDKWLVDRFTVGKTVHGFGGGGVVDVNSDKARAFELAEQFVADLKAGRTDAAYALATPAFRKRVPLAEFKTGGKAFTGIHSHIIQVRQSTQPAEGQSFDFDVDLGFGNVAKLTAVSGGGNKWLVDQFVIPPAALTR